METALFDFYSKPITNPLYWYLKSALGRMARFVLPIVVETVHDVLVDKKTVKDAFLNNLLQQVVDDESSSNQVDSQDEIINSTINKPDDNTNSQGNSTINNQEETVNTHDNSTINKVPKRVHEQNESFCWSPKRSRHL